MTYTKASHTSVAAMITRSAVDHTAAERKSILLSTIKSEKILDREEAELATRAAWLYHVGGLLQADVARELNLSPFKINRLIAIAAEYGFVRTIVDGPIAGCVALEQRLKERFSLGMCRVVPERGADPIRAIGAAAAAFLDSVLRNGEHRLIGIGHGRTLAAINHNMPSRQETDVEFVSLLGSLPSRISSYPFEAIYHLTDRTGALAHLIPAPLYADSSEDRAVFMRQSTTKVAFERMPEVTLCMIGIGAIDDKPLTDIKMGAIPQSDLEVVKRGGGVGEVLGCYFNEEGGKLDIDLHRRVIAMPPEALADKEAVAICGGEGKVTAIRAILAAHLLAGLITTEQTARSLLAMDEAARTRLKKRPIKRR